MIENDNLISFTFPNHPGSDVSEYHRESFILIEFSQIIGHT